MSYNQLETKKSAAPAPFQVSQFNTQPTPAKHLVLLICKELRKYFSDSGLLSSNPVSVIIGYVQYGGWEGWALTMIASDDKVSWAAIVGNNGGIWGQLHADPNIKIDSLTFPNIRKLAEEWDNNGNFELKKLTWTKNQRAGNVIVAKNNSEELVIRKLNTCMVMAGSDNAGATVNLLAVVESTGNRLAYSGY